MDTRGIWIRTRSNKLEVLVQVGTTWRLIYSHGRDFTDENTSHIVEPGGILNAPEDTELAVRQCPACSAVCDDPDWFSCHECGEPF